MLDQTLLQLALTLTFNVQDDDPCTNQAIQITYNQEVYEPYPLKSQGGQVLQIVEAHTQGTRYIIILSNEAQVLSFLSSRSGNQWMYETWNKGQLAGTLQALQSDNNFQLIRPAYCDLPTFNMNQYGIY